MKTMNESANEVLAAALRLAVDDRAFVAAELLASMDQEDQESVHRAWAREIEARLARAKAGSMTFSDWKDVEARLRRKHLSA